MYHAVALSALVDQPLEDPVHSKVPGRFDRRAHTPILSPAEFNQCFMMLFKLCNDEICINKISETQLSDYENRGHLVEPSSHFFLWIVECPRICSTISVVYQASG